ncbi:MAG: hypothetical protein HUJ63_08120, partial [Enterococcus sp.]|nr:hypothetical protein [Enterococcus sp.]
MAAIDKKLDEARSKINWERRKEAETDPVKWINTYCIGFFLDDPPPPKGEEIIREMWCALNDKIRPYMVLQSRGSGKTSYVESVLMMAIATGVHNYCVLISQNATSAQSLLNDIFGIVLDPSPFSEDYPDLCLPFQLCNGSYRRKQSYLGVQTDIQKCASKLIFPRLKNPDGTEVKTSSACIETKGITSGIRGMKHGTKRPTCVILDDIQDDETAYSSVQVEKLLSIINKSVLNLGGKGKISVLQTATPICPDDLVEIISKDKNWKTTVFPAFIKWPKDIEENPKDGLWAQYFKIFDDENTTDSGHSKSLEFYVKNREKMDAGADVLNPNRFKKEDGHVSAIQALLEKKHQIGDSAFFSEFQMQPKRFDYVVDINPRKVFKKINIAVNKKSVPDGFLTTYLTMDLNTSYGITYNIVSFRPDSTSVVIAHNIYKCQIDQALNELQYNQTVYDKISECVKHIKTFNIKI